MIWRLGFQYTHNAFDPFFSLSCSSTLIAVVRHLNFIDFIQLALRTENGTSNAFSHQYLFTIALWFHLFGCCCCCCLCFVLVFFLSQKHCSTQHIIHNILSLFWRSTILFTFLHCCWRINISVKECNIHQPEAIQMQVSNRFYITNDIRISIEWRFLWLRCTFEFMTKMIYLNVYTTKCHFFLMHRLYSSAVLCCISLAFLSSSFSSSSARRMPTSNNNLLTFTPI